MMSKRRIWREAVGGSTGRRGMVLEVLGTPGQKECWLGLRWQRSRDPFSFLSRPFGLLPLDTGKQNSVVEGMSGHP